MRALLLAAWLLAAGAAVASPTAEFEAPYAIRVLPGGEVVEISGSFSWAVPQNLTATLAAAPRVRTVRLDSPGGYLQPALQVAEIIRVRNLDTYVPRMCASACTVVFLAGKDRFLGPDGRLGFHQAHAPGVAPERLDPLLRGAYESLGVPPSFIDHVLRTPPTSIWFPDQQALRASRLTTGSVPPALLKHDDAVVSARRLDAVWPGRSGRDTGGIPGNDLPVAGQVAARPSRGRLGVPAQSVDRLVRVAETGCGGGVTA